MKENRVFLSVYCDDLFVSISKHLTAKNIGYDAPTNRYTDDIGQMFIGNYSAYVFDTMSLTINKKTLEAWYRETGDLTPLILLENFRPKAIGNTFIYISNHAEYNMTNLFKN